MSELFNELDETAERLEKKVRIAEANRMSLLSVHSFLGITAGACILRYGGPRSYDYLMSPDTARSFLGVLALSGGISLALGLVWNRKLALELLGMLQLWIWDAILTRGFFGGWRNGLSDSPQVVVVYLSLTIFMSIHIVTVIWKMYQRRKEYLL